MGRLAAPHIRTFRSAISAFDMYNAGTQCHSVPVAFVPIIIGALHELQYPHVWRGSKADIALIITQVNDFIGKFGTVDTLCLPATCGDDSDNENNRASGGGIVIEVEDMGQVVTEIKAIDGGIRVYYGHCCYEDVMLEGVSLVPENGDYTLPPERDTEETIYSCGMAMSIASTFMDLSEYIWDNAATIGGILLVWQAQDHVSLDLNNTRTAAAVAQALIMQGVTLVSGGVVDLEKSDVIQTDLQQLIACTLEAFTQSVEGLDGDRLLDEIDAIMLRQFPIDNANNLFIRNFYGEIARSIGKGALVDLALNGMYDDTADCTCPVGDNILAPSIYFNGVYDPGNPSGGALELAQVDYGGKRINIQIAYSAGGADKNVQDILLNLAGGQDGDYITVRMYPNEASPNAGVPVRPPTDYLTEPPVDEWCRLQFTGGNPGIEDVAGANYSQWLSTLSPTSNPSQVEIISAYRWPEPSATDVRHNFYIEIVAINGEWLGAIGP